MVDNNRTYNRQFSFTEPIMFQGEEYPSTDAMISDGRGNEVAGRVFTDANGQYYTMQNGNIQSVTPVHTLDEVTVTAPKRYNAFGNNWDSPAIKSKEYENNLIGLVEGLWDKFRGNNTYKVNPLDQGEVRPYNPDEVDWGKTRRSQNKVVNAISGTWGPLMAVASLPSLAGAFISAPIATAATFGGGYVGGKAVDYASKFLTGRDFGTNVAMHTPFTPGMGNMLNPGYVVGGRAGKGAYNIGKILYDEGILWDKYTTFRGRFGNYGDNLLTNMYGTYARRFGLPDQARLPADAIRKLTEDPSINSNGMINFTGYRNYAGNPHINTTFGRPVVSHSIKNNWDGADTYLFPFKDFIDQTKNGALKSIEPSDAFANGAEVLVSPNKVTVISGDVNTLERARRQGMQTLSSPKLRRMYETENATYQKELQSASSNPLSKVPRPPKKSKKASLLPYATEMQRLQSMRGTPTLEDIRLLEQQTGLNAGVAPISEYSNAINSLNSMLNPSIQDIMNGKVKPYVYPNGRVVDFTPDKIKKELELIQRAKYDNVFYDPATWAEFNWQERMGIK